MTECLIGQGVVIDIPVLLDEISEPYVGDVIRKLGHEYGATTGRPRRTGWFDAVMLESAKYALGAD